MILETRRESKTVVDSGFHALDSGLRTPDSRYGIPDSLSLELGFRILILIVSGISDSKAQDWRFLKQKFPRFRNLDSLTWGEVRQANLDTWLTGSWFWF